MHLVGSYIVIFCVTIFALCRLGESTLESILPHTINITWEIVNWSSQRNSQTVLLSPKFTAPTNNNFKWFLSAKFQDQNTMSVGLYADPENEEKQANARFAIALMNKRNKPEYRLETEHQFTNSPSVNDPLGESWGWTNYIALDQEFNEKYVNMDTVTFFLELEFSTEATPQEGTLSQRETDLISLNIDFSTDNDTKANLLTDLLLKNNGCADAVLVTNDTQYPVHKVILASRSKFLSNVIETVLSLHPGEPIHIDLGNKDQHVVEEFLKFVYVSKFILTKENVGDLLELASKFQIQDLKDAIHVKVSKSISPQDALKIYALASRYKDDELKATVIKVILDASMKDPNALCDLCIQSECTSRWH